MDYLLEALKRRELFAWLHLTPLTFWHALLLRDRFNFLGLVAPVPDALKQQLSQQPGALTQVRKCGFLRPTLLILHYVLGLREPI